MKKAILRTLAYADVFDFPLKEDEIWKWLIRQSKRAGERESKREFAHSLKLASDSRQIRVTDGFYHLHNRKEIVKLREQRETWSQSKLKIARRVASWLRFIPWIKMVGVTGALAMNNSEKDDDIDLLVVTSKKRLWLSRGLMITFLRFLGLYRRQGKIKDKICPNMLLDEKHLAIPKKERDLFSAHEVCQMRPLWERGRTYQRYLRANQWSKEFLPNWKP